MKKEIYLINGVTNESYQQFSKRIQVLANKLTEDEDIHQLKIVFTSEAPPSFSVIPFKKGKMAAFSVFSEKKGMPDLLIREPGFSGAYKVEEALPVAYEKNWDNGQDTPGICLLTLFRQKKGLDYATFIHRWHKGHTPLSLKIHPLWNYNRNVVQEILSNSSNSWDGIVEEHFRTSSDLLNPLKFFGNPFVMVYNMLRVYFDTKLFIEYKTIEPYLTREIHLKGESATFSDNL